MWLTCEIGRKSLLICLYENNIKVIHQGMGFRVNTFYVLCNYNAVYLCLWQLMLQKKRHCNPNLASAAYGYSTFISWQQSEKQHDICLFLGLTLNMWGPSYLGWTRSISWLLMPWLLAPPGHQPPWYWLCKIGKSWSFIRGRISIIYGMAVWRNDIKCKCMSIFPKFST